MPSVTPAMIQMMNAADRQPEGDAGTAGDQPTALRCAQERVAKARRLATIGTASPAANVRPRKIAR